MPPCAWRGVSQPPWPCDPLDASSDPLPNNKGVSRLFRSDSPCGAKWLLETIAEEVAVGMAGRGQTAEA